MASLEWLLSIWKIVHFNWAFQSLLASFSQKTFSSFFSNLALNQCVYTHYLNEVLQKRKWSLLTTVRRGRKKKENHKSTRIMRKLTFKSWLKNSANAKELLCLFGKKFIIFIHHFNIFAKEKVFEEGFWLLQKLLHSQTKGSWGYSLIEFNALAL